MNTMLKTENDILESKELRNELLSRTEVLDKVKTLFLLPKLEMMTMSQVAEYYGVDVEAVRKCYVRNKDEIASDGAVKQTSKTIIERFGLSVPSVATQTYKEFQLDKDVVLRVPNPGVVLFPKRAILRIGMLLRDSEIAKEVRTQLLNVFEEATPEQRTAKSDEEQEIALGFLDALSNNDTQQILLSFQKYAQFKNRHITELQTENEEIKTDNQMLAGEILKWSDRSQVNRIVRYLSHVLKIDPQYVFTDLYKELLYKHSINLALRLAKSKKKTATKLDMVRDSEWPVLQQSLAALCQKHGYSPEEINKNALKYQG